MGVKLQATHRDSVLSSVPTVCLVLNLCCAVQNLEDFLKKIEAEKGVTGYRKIHADLIAKSEQTAQVRGHINKELYTIVAIGRASRITDVQTGRRLFYTVCNTAVWWTLRKGKLPYVIQNMMAKLGVWI